MSGIKLTMYSLVAASALLITGCGGVYTWRPSVPENMRTVVVPTFRNETELTEIGSVVTRQVLREFQREGTFKLASSDEAAVEIQGVVKAASLSTIGHNRRNYSRVTASDFKLVVEISVIDRKNGKVVLDNYPLEASVSTVAGMDNNTAERDASGRAADALSREIVDRVMGLKW